MHGTVSKDGATYQCEVCDGDHPIGLATPQWSDLSLYWHTSNEIKRASGKNAFEDLARYLASQPGFRTFRPYPKAPKAHACPKYAGKAAMDRAAALQFVLLTPEIEALYPMVPWRDLYVPNATPAKPRLILDIPPSKRFYFHGDIDEGHPANRWCQHCHIFHPPADPVKGRKNDLVTLKNQVKYTRQLLQGNFHRPPNAPNVFGDGKLGRGRPDWNKYGGGWYCDPETHNDP